MSPGSSAGRAGSADGASGGATGGGGTGGGGTGGTGAGDSLVRWSIDTAERSDRGNNADGSRRTSSLC